MKENTLIVYAFILKSPSQCRFALLWPEYPQYTHAHSLPPTTSYRRLKAICTRVLHAQAKSIDATLTKPLLAYSNFECSNPNDDDTRHFEYCPIRYGLKQYTFDIMELVQSHM